jgi:hypothetical protein
MEHAEIQDYARRLMEALGTKSIVEAADKARRFEQAGDSEQARDWREIQQVLMSLRGPAVS